MSGLAVKSIKVHYGWFRFKPLGGYQKSSVSRRAVSSQVLPAPRHNAHAKGGTSLVPLPHVPPALANISQWAKEPVAACATI